MTLTAEELEYIAQEEEVEIMPRVEIPTMWLITGDVGPFEVGMPIKIPLWIALQLRGDNKCNIIAPYWLTKSSMEKVKEFETKSPLFSKMPSKHYMSIAKLIFELCPEDVPEADAIKLLIKDVWDCRMAKLQTAIALFIEKGASWAKVDNLTQMEMCAIRPFFPHSLGHIHRLRKTIQAARLHSAGNASVEVRGKLPK
ncbi:DNA replication complex GINS protein PSF2 [Orchesella cincta]|uniref:DNA replication complex GINS protein PSF2 n=1 Tax=Orchesella cincta TaxID=48709 RepID=A0A1D2N155_ORCCI|nr:DNA replication complex GINS protein PSF2 [Orchesella cincta]